MSAPVASGNGRLGVYNFLIGLAIGWIAGSWYSRDGRQPVRIEDARRRASNAIEESRRLLEDSKRELQETVMGASRQSERTERQRRPRTAGPPHRDTGETGEATG